MQSQFMSIHDDNAIMYNLNISEIISMGFKIAYVQLINQKQHHLMIFNVIETSQPKNRLISHGKYKHKSIHVCIFQFDLYVIIFNLVYVGPYTQFLRFPPFCTLDKLNNKWNDSILIQAYKQNQHCYNRNIFFKFQFLPRCLIFYYIVIPYIGQYKKRQLFISRFKFIFII